jgi:hypothetical protein
VYTKASRLSPISPCNDARIRLSLSSVLRYAAKVIQSRDLEVKMQSFRASVQYGDWRGAAAADDTQRNSVQAYLEKKKLIESDEFLIATSLWVGENDDQGKLGSVFARAFLFRGHRDFESVRDALAEIPGPIPVRTVDIPLTLTQIVGMFKRFDVMFTWRGLELEDREYDTPE